MAKTAFIGLVRNRTPGNICTKLSAIRVMAEDMREAVQQIKVTAGYPIELYYICVGSDTKKAIDTYRKRWT